MAAIQYQWKGNTNTETQQARCRLVMILRHSDYIRGWPAAQIQSHNYACQYVPLVPHSHLTGHLKNRDFLASNFSHKYSQHFLSIKTGDLNIPPVFCSVWSWSWSYTVKVGAINKTAQIISPQNFLFHPNLPNLQLRRSLLKPQLTNLFLYSNDDKNPG